MTADPVPHTDIDPDTAFEAMRVFLEAYWRRGGCDSDAIASLLGNLNRTGKGGTPADPAMWSDWVEAVQIALSDDNKGQDWLITAKG